MSTWTGQAHLLADAIREPGFDAAAANAAAWAAGVNPDATAGLIGAATALTSGECGPQLWAQAGPCPSDQAMLASAAELEGACAELLKCASALARDCRAALAAAVARLAAAGAALAAAQGRGDEPAAAAAQGQQGAALAEIADCEAALEVIDDAGGRLEHAANCLRRVPDDLAGTYEQPYAHVRDGGDLPYSGDFLTGGIVTAGARGAAAGMEPEPAEDSPRARERRWRHDFDLVASRLAGLGALTEVRTGDRCQVTVDESAVPERDRHLVRDFWALWDEGIVSGFLAGGGITIGAA